MLVLRRETERPEAVAAGTVKLAGVEEDIFSMARGLLTDPRAYAAMAHAVNPHGDGLACRRIADAIGVEIRPAGGAPAPSAERDRRSSEQEVWIWILKTVWPSPSPLPV